MSHMSVLFSCCLVLCSPGGHWVGIHHSVTFYHRGFLPFVVLKWIIFAHKTSLGSSCVALALFNWTAFTRNSAVWVDEWKRTEHSYGSRVCAEYTPVSLHLVWLKCQGWSQRSGCNCSRISDWTVEGKAWTFSYCTDGKPGHVWTPLQSHLAPSIRALLISRKPSVFFTRSYKPRDFD